MALVVSAGDGHHLIEPAVAQCVGRITDESAGLLAAYPVEPEPVADDDNRIDQHEREQDDIGLAEPSHRGP